MQIRMLLLYKYIKCKIPTKNVGIKFYLINRPRNSLRQLESYREFDPTVRWGFPVKTLSAAPKFLLFTNRPPNCAVNSKGRG